MSGRDQFLDRFRRGGNSRFALTGLGWNADSHGVLHIENE
jgi:hypothetical protein